MKVIVGALGTGNVPKRGETAEGQKTYEGTKYDFGDGVVIDADYSLYAVATHEKPDLIVVLLTAKAREKQWEGLKEWLDTLREDTKTEFKVIDVTIPDGASQAEAWTIFQNISKHVPRDSELTIDITFGLRSIPVLLLSAARYLQRANNVRLSRIYYGAYESKRENVTPMYSLDSFVTLLDWATAVDIFTRTGSSVLLADLLGQQQNNLKLPKGDQIVDALKQLSLSLDLIRSKGVLVAAHKLVHEVDSSLKSQLAPADEPIAALMNQVAGEFRPFAMGEPASNLQDFQRKTLKLIEWYQRRNRYAEALLLSREWCLTWVMTRDGKGGNALWNRANREGYASIMGSRPEVKHLWGDLTKYRNQLAHAESYENVSVKSTMTARKLNIGINAVLSEVLKLGQQL